MKLSDNNTIRIAVIGAGVSGLTAACKLGEHGHDVTVLETQSRVGGRAITIRDPFPDDLVAQAGPARFPADFSRVLSYAREFDLELAPFYPQSGTVVAYFKGKKIEEYKPSPEEFWGYTAIVNRYPGRAESISLRVALCVRSVARRILRRPTWMTYIFRDGTDRLTDALAASAQADIRLESTVESIVQNSDSISVKYSSPHGSTTLEVDYVVCATPLSVLGDMKFSPQLNAAKANLVSEIPFSSAVRIFLQMRRAYWRDSGHNGFAVTDTLGEIWDPHYDSDTGPALLVCYAKGKLADKLCALDEKSRLKHVVSELENIFPGAEKHFEHGISFNWREQPWIRGGWPLVREGFAHRIGEFRNPHGRIYFAGDYAAAPKWLNMMEGAIESGEYVARQIHQAKGEQIPVRFKKDQKRTSGVLGIERE